MSDAERSTKFGRLLQELRDRAGLTQEALAERAGLGRRSIQGIERGENVPHRETIERLARALSLTGPEQAQFVAAIPPSPHRRRAAGAVHSNGAPNGKRKAPPGRGGLPVSLTSFLGREAEIARVTDLLTSPSSGCRLLTLTGAPGVGKTRLAIEVAASLSDDFADGIYIVPLAPVVDANLVLLTIAQSLGVGGIDGQPLVDRLSHVLEGRQILLVLDNFEQVAPAAPLLAQVLERCPVLRVLVTSRARLRVRGEHEFVVSPLAVPELTRDVANNANLVSLVEQSPAVQLFVARGRALRPEFAVTSENAYTIAEICRRLDGLPLAIELAAARLKLLTPAAILDQLTSRLRLLVSGPRDLPPRQQTLRAAIAWSEDLLDDSQRQLFRRLAICTGGFGLSAVLPRTAGSATPDSAATALRNRPDGNDGTRQSEADGEAALEPRGGCDDGTGWGSRELDLATTPLVTLGPPGEASGAESHLALAVIQGVEALVDQSLLVVMEQGREPRYRMVETVREYGLERLAATGELELVSRQHATFFLALADDAAANFGGPREAEAIVRLEEDYANLGTALRYWIDRDEIDRALRLGGILQWLCVYRGYADETRMWLEELLPLLKRAGRVADQAKILLTLARMACHTGDNAGAWQRCEESLAAAREVDDREGIAEALAIKGLIARSQGKYDLARSASQESLEIWRELGNPGAIGAQLDRLGTIAYFQGDNPTARALLEESLAIRRELGDPVFLSYVLLEYGRFLHNVEDFDRARAHYEESLAIWRTIGFRSALAETLAMFADLLLDLGDQEGADPMLRESMALARDTGSLDAITILLELFARRAASLDQPQRALRLVAAARRLRERIDNAIGPDLERRLIRVVEPARRALDVDAAQRAEAEGRAMSMEEAIAYALDAEHSLAT